MRYLLFIGLIVGSVVFVIWCIKHRSSKIVPWNDVLIAFTGIMGAGKTALAVLVAKVKYRRAVKYCLRHRLPKPEIYSNVPIKIGKYRSLDISNDITLLRKKIPRFSVVLIDEIGSYATQFDFKAENIEFFAEFVRFFRHYVRGTLIVTDQSSDNIVKVVRCRINTVVNLHDFHKFPLVPFITVDARPICISEEIRSLVQVNEDDPTGFYRICFFGNPFKNYDSFCYSVRYDCLDDFIGNRSRQDMKQPDLFTLDQQKRR